MKALRFGHWLNHDDGQSHLIRRDALSAAAEESGRLTARSH